MSLPDAKMFPPSLHLKFCEFPLAELWPIQRVTVRNEPFSDIFAIMAETIGDPSLVILVEQRALRRA
jgi:hypothetical protein